MGGERHTPGRTVESFRRSPDVSDEALRELGRAYGVRHLDVVTRVKSGRGNAVFRLTSERGDVALRLLRPDRDHGRVRAQHELMRFLLDGGIPVSVVLSATGGDTLVEADGWWFDAFAWIDGEEFKRGSAPSAAAAGLALARFHERTAGRSIPGLGGRAFMAKYAAAVRRFETESAQGRAVTDVPKEVSTLRRQLAEAKKEIDTLDYDALPALIGHGDLSLGNVLLRDGRVAAFLDLEHAAYEARALDVSIAVSHLGRVEDPERRVDGACASAFLRAYTSAHPLEPREIEALPALALTRRASAAAKRVWRLNECVPERVPRQIAKLKREIEKFDIVLRDAPRWRSVLGH